MDMLSWGTGEAAVQQPAAYLERLVLSAPLLEDKSFKGAHYLTIVVQSPLYSWFTHTYVLEHMPCVRFRIKPTGLSGLNG